MYKKILICLVLLLAGVSASIWMNQDAPTPLPPIQTVETQTKKSAPVGPTVSLSVGQSTYVVPFKESQTVLDAMQSATREGFTYTGQQYPGLGFFVESVQGKGSADGYYWILYLNDATSTLGVSALKLREADHIQWRYEKGY